MVENNQRELEDRGGKEKRVVSGLNIFILLFLMKIDAADKNQGNGKDMMIET